MATTAPASAFRSLQRLELLFELPGLPRYRLPASLWDRYGGDIGFPDETLYANFVSSLDGVVALGNDAAPAEISLHAASDRLVMALLRACADAVVIGAGTLRSEPQHLWRPEFLVPEESEAFAELRRELGRAPAPQLVIVTASGRLETSAPVLEAGALVLTTPDGARRLRESLPASCGVVEAGPGPQLEGHEIMGVLRHRGFRVVLTEGGPSLLGTLIAEGLLDELFLTLSPAVAGRNGAPRPGLVEGVSFGAGELPSAELLSLRRAGSHLFARYQFSRLIEIPS